VNGLERFEETGRAAQGCAELNFGGFKDWFLPSQGELNLMYQNLKTKRLGGLGDAWYWSSSESTVEYSWCQNFSDGRQVGEGWNSDAKKEIANSVRAVRQF
jgi:hypothetical protein